jgi:tRNA-(ms[2]io[6]A)-hydroxylase
MIEARSCERFKVLSENIKDAELAKFYRDLEVGATHPRFFLLLPANTPTMLTWTNAMRMDEFETSIIAQSMKRKPFTVNLNSFGLDKKRIPF